MKEANNKEIDLLLRDLAKRSRSAGNASLPAGEHLDADELSSFAEGVLPEATRALYVSHLADCDRCRKIVAQLMAASGALVPAKTGSAKAGLWSYFSDIFTPKVLRFALPVLSIAIIAGIGLMLMRQSSQSEFVAQVNSENKPVEVAQPAAKNTEAQSSQMTADEHAAKQSPSPKTVEAKKPEAFLDSPTETKNETASADKAKETKEAEKAEKSGVKGEAAQAPAETATVTGGRAEASTPKPQSETTRESVAGFARGRQAPVVANDNLAKSADRKLRDTEEEDRKDAAAKRAPAPATVATETRRVSKNKTDDDAQAAETRTVAGRRFRQTANGWIDAAYNSSMSLTNVARGSEQYRALIGDEPGLRTIAEQLPGEVIVVWKGKAYRIK
jgi:hypothetical protein